MHAFHKRLDRVCLLFAWIGGAAMLVISLMIVVDVLLRKFFAYTSGSSAEIAGYLFAAALTFSLPLVFLRRGNVRIDTVYMLLPRRWKAVLDVIGVVLFLGITLLLAKSAWGVVNASWIANSRSLSALSMPLWIPQAFWFAGLVFFSFVMACAGVMAFIALCRGDIQFVDDLAGIPSLIEETRDNTTEAHLDLNP